MPGFKVNIMNKKVSMHFLFVHLFIFLFSHFPLFSPLCLYMISLQQTMNFEFVRYSKVLKANYKQIGGLSQTAMMKLF